MPINGGDSDGVGDTDGGGDGDDDGDGDGVARMVIITRTTVIMVILDDVHDGNVEEDDCGG